MVKVEQEDCVLIGAAGLEKAPREGRVVLDSVEVPTWREVQEHKHNPKKYNGEDLSKEALLKKIKNPKVKIKAGLALNTETLYDRIKGMNAPVFDVPLPQVLRDLAVPRDFLSHVFGGNPQETFPSIGKHFFEQHGLKDFMYLSLDYNPEAPQVPGAPGLFFAPRSSGEEPWQGAQRLITRLAVGMWQYMGQYQMTLAEPLTTAEWAAQSDKFRNTWSKEICIKSWGKQIVRFVAARKRFGCRNPTEAQIRSVEDSGEYKNITPEDVKNAFGRGDEVLEVWEMRCIGYDSAFQQNIVERFKTWKPLPRRPKKRRNVKNSNDQTGRQVQAGKKRKRAQSDTSPSSYSGESNSE